MSPFRQRSGCVVTLAVGLLSVAPGRVSAQTRAPAPTPAAPVTSTVTGTLVDEGGIPVEGAQLRVDGSELITLSGADGAFRLTGLTAGKAAIEVTKEGFSMLAFDFDIAAGVTVALRLTITSLPPAPSAPEPASAAVDTTSDTLNEPSGAKGTAAASKVTFRGTVVDSSGAPLFGAIIEEASSRLRTMTDSGGRFRLQGVEPGLSFIRVRKLGFLAEYFPMTGVAGRTVAATIRLRPAGQQLAKVEVNADAMNGDRRMRGYFERAARGTGIFIDRTEILRRNATQVSDMLRGRNGVTVYGQGANGNVIAGRTMKMGGGQGPGICPLPLILDGMVVALREGLTVDRVVNLQDVRAMEIYPTGPSVPAELANGQTECGAIVVWTR